MEYVKHRFLKENSIESRLYQEQILDTATKKNLLVVLPTGLGKTALAALVAAHRLEKFPDAQILFLVPTRPLAAQHKKTFENFFALPAQDFYVLTGVISPAKRALQYDRKIIFSTPQVIENDTKTGALSLANFSLVIFDEAHRAVGDYAYPFIAKEYQKHATNPLILALTASPGGTYEKIQTICKNLGVQAVEIRTEKDEDVAPFMKEVNTEWVFVELPQQFKEIQALLKKFLETKAQKLAEWHLLEPNRLGKGKLIELQKSLQVMIKRSDAGYAFFALSAVAELLKVEYALEMLESQGIDSLNAYFKKMSEDAVLGKSKAVKRIVGDPLIKESMALALKLSASGNDHPKMGELKKLVGKQIRINPDSKIIIFSNYRNTVANIVSTLREVEGCKPVAFVGQATRYDVGMKQKEQMERLEQFSQGEYNCLIGTSISEEGLHVPAVDLAIFYEPVPSEIRTIQRRGRVGRTKVGKIVFLVAKDTRDEAYYWSAYHKERKMKSVLRHMKGKELNFAKEKKTIADWIE